MKDLDDKLTGDLITKRGRGRPATGKALTPAQKQKAYRERKKSLSNAESNGDTDKSVAVMLNRAERTAIVVMLQDKVREMACRRLGRDTANPKDLESEGWVANLARKIAQAERNN